MGCSVDQAGQLGRSASSGRSLGVTSTCAQPKALRTAQRPSPARTTDLVAV